VSLGGGGQPRVAPKLSDRRATCTASTTRQRRQADAILVGDAPGEQGRRRATEENIHPNSRSRRSEKRLQRWAAQGCGGGC